MKEKKVLSLTVSKKWFDKIMSGEKTEEYREIKPCWIKRLVDIVSANKLGSGEKASGPFGYIYTHVLFINGYGKNRPRIEKEIVSVTIGKPKKGLCPDKWLNKEFFVIKFK